jgi:hypothetical protein
MANVDPKAAVTKWDIFLAHSSHDTATARKLYDLLSSTFRVFLDVCSLEPGGDWHVEIPRAQRESRATVILLSSTSQRAYYAREEVARGIALARADGTRHEVFPVYLEGAPSEDMAPYGLLLKQSLVCERDGGLSGVAEKLRSIVALVKEQNEPAVVQTTATECVLCRYPRGPMVPSFKVKRTIKEAFADLIPPARAMTTVEDAIALRLEADPYDSEVTYIRRRDLVPPETVAPMTFWNAVFTEACLHGPRMLAALLMAVDERMFSEEAKNDRQALLRNLQTNI